ncbi:MAG TPA: sugar transferase [Thermoanaerobaculia bacterium]|jgi:lipopolysaccharide/colanic/teichoic acid biosynthesis glycosyltransferase
MKRLMDVTIAAVLLVVLSPLIALLMVLVRVMLGSPVIFRQRRPGLHEQPFTIYKFRTMTDARGPDGQLLPDSKRLTRFGRWLRASSLDELPELWNVLEGTMSLVGPRPLLPEYLPYYRERERLRHTVRPGITGHAQVNGRNAAGWDERLEMDAWYVENWSPLLDLRILLATVKAVVNRKGVAIDPRSEMLDLNVERSR